MPQPIRDLNEINTETQEGQLLMAALILITTESRRDKTPSECLEELQAISDKNNNFQPEWDYKELVKTVKGGK